MALSAPASSSFVSEVQRKTGSSILTLSEDPHCVNSYTNTQLETAVVSKGWQQKRAGQESSGRKQVPTVFLPFLDPEVLQPYKSAVSYA